jgi:hypothetical protein
MNDNDYSFIGKSIAKMATHKINISLENKSQVYQTIGEIKCVGYFDENNKTYSVAMKKARRDWFPVFVHEYCHFEQWLEKASVFKTVANNDKLEKNIWLWLDNKKFKGKEITYEDAKRSIRANQKLELDCEKRVIQKIKEHNLSIDEEYYIKLSNIYILMFSMILETRKWYSCEPYAFDQIIDVTPNYWLDDYTKIPKEFKRLMKELCYD